MTQLGLTPAALLAQSARFLGAGRPAEAIPSLAAAAAALPGHAGVLHDLGLAYLECGAITEAIGALQASVAADPGLADSHLRLAIALEAAGSFDAALKAYDRAAECPRSRADAQYRAGDLLDSIGRIAPSGSAFRASAAAAPGTVLGWIAAARALLADDRHDEAVSKLRQALAVDPGNAVALDLLGGTLAELGLGDQAIEAFAAAIAQDPLRAGAYYDIARCRRIIPQDEPLIGRMQAALAQPGLDAGQRARVHLALGKACDDLGRYEEAMRHFDSAEACRNAVISFDLPAFEARVDRLIAAFDGEVMTRARPAARGVAPILILGLPRSGTTLVEQILSAHPDVRAGGELPFWNERGAAWEGAASAGPAGAGLNAAAPDATFLDQAAADYRHVLTALAHGRTRVTDKMPLNFQWAGMIHLAVPDAVMLHCLRSPLDTALSIHQTHFNMRMPFPTGGAALVGMVRAYQRLCAHWRRVLPASHFVDVEYEALTKEPERVIRQVLLACGLPWHEACLHPERNTRIVRTPSKWQARQKITRSAVGRWRAYEPFLGPLRGLLPDAN
jgi:tetratricopeptide (TPR) repeat protein